MSTDRPALMATVVARLRAIAPGVEAETRVSMDWLNFLVNLHEHVGVTIPEADYASLVSLDNVVDCLKARLGWRYRPSARAT